MNFFSSNVACLQLRHGHGTGGAIGTVYDLRIVVLTNIIITIALQFAHNTSMRSVVKEEMQRNQSSGNEATTAVTTGNAGSIGKEKKRK